MMRKKSEVLQINGQEFSDALRVFIKSLGWGKGNANNKYLSSLMRMEH